MSILSYFKPISTALLPNAEADDIKLVLKSFLPWNWGKWREGEEINELENKFSQYLGVKQAISFSSGRIGLYAILKALSDIQNSKFKIQNFEVIIQAYTTIALSLAIKQAGFTPVYVDMKENTYNIDAAKIEAKITEWTKAIIVQHTFGIPAEIDKIAAICKKHNLFLIEDCAHSLGAEFAPSNSSGQAAKKIGTFGDAAFFSFGRDKIISSTSGGMVIARDEKLAGKIREFQSNLDFPPIKWIFQQLLHPLVFWCALPVYYFLNIGKAKIFLAQRLGIISRAYNKEEKNGMIGFASSPLNLGGVREGIILQSKLPNVLAILILNQFKKIERFNNHRRKIAEIYEKEFHYDNMNYHSEANKAEIVKHNKNSFHFDTLMYQSEIKLPEVSENSKPAFLYYTIQVERRDELLEFAARKHIILGDWFPGALGPKGVDELKFGYRKGDCPIAEQVGARSLNLPTNIKTSEADARKVIEVIKEFLGKKNI